MRRGILSMTILIVGGVAWAQQDSPRAARVDGFLEAFGSGDPAALWTFMATNATPEWLANEPKDQRLALFARLMDELGAIEAGMIAFDGDRTVKIRGSAENINDGVTLELWFEPAKPYRLTGFGLDRSGAGRPKLPDEVGFDRKGRAALDRYLRAQAEKDAFAGSVLVTRDGEVLFEGAYGLAERGWKIPNAMSTRFDVGSIGKDFTKVAIGQLIAAGKVRLDDTILDHRPDFGNDDVAGRITVAHLLDFRSGLADIFVPAFFEANRARFRTGKDYFPLFANEPLLFEPGAEERYSNSSYVVLGEIVAAASGQSYHDYIREHVFRPAAMGTADFLARDEINENMAVGYTRQGPTNQPGGALRSAEMMKPVIGIGAGGAYATAADLVAFDRAVRQHRLLSPRYTAWFFSGTLPEDAVDTSPATAPIGTAGGGPGTSACLESNGRLVVAVLANLDPPSGEALAIALFERLRSTDR